MERITMSQEERDKLEWLKRAKDKVISQRFAAGKMGVSDRWVRKLLGRMKKQGDAVVVQGLRGRASNRKIKATVRAEALELLKQPDGHDFGPTFASEQLAKRHKVEVGKETLRGWMIEAGLWKSRGRKLDQVHVWRERRSGFGELVQWDTSTHDWLEGRGPVRYLVRLIDDATSWSWGRFVEQDATPQNMAVLWEYLDRNGRMVDVYTDRHSMFAVKPRGRFAQPVADFPDHHRSLTPALDLAAILCHVEQRVIGNDYTFSFAGRRYQIARDQVQAGMRHQPLRVELRLSGELQAR
jgi:transposase